MVKDILQEKAAYHCLATHYFAGSKRLVDLFSAYKSWSLAFENSSLKGNPMESYALLKQMGIDLVLPVEPNFPKTLLSIKNPPLGLYYRGSLPKADTPIASFVGTRKASVDGSRLARKLSGEVAREGVTVVSGLALGIDSEAHRGAVEVGGKTIAVLAVGLDRIYPSVNTALAEKIISSGGALISEYPPETKSLARFFLHRNRLIAGLGKVTVVIESPLRSGSLSTASFANRFGKKVLAVPGSLSNINYAGSNELIKQKLADLMTCSADILAVFGERKKRLQKSLLELSTIDKNCKIILTMLMSSPKGLHPDKIADVCDLDLVVVNESLTDLTLANLIIESRGHYSSI